MLNQNFFRHLLLPALLFSVILLPARGSADDSFNSTVQIQAFKQYLNGYLELVSIGSGTIIGENGDILTNAHVVYDDDLDRPWDAFAICVSVDQGEFPECRFSGTLERYDEKIDLAILSIDKIASWGAFPSIFPFVSYKNPVASNIGDKASVRGFPGNGGGTITVTQGQISGFAQINGYKYLKTDADIDAGNSGGTMFNDAGQFIGVPSYIVSYYENSGRALDISEINKWMDSTVGKKGTANSVATKKLREEQKAFHLARETAKANFKSYPKLSVEAPSGWEFTSLGDTSFSMYNPKNPYATIEVEIISTAFELKMDLSKKLEMFNKASKDEFDDHAFIKIDGSDALHMWAKGTDGSVHIISVARGYKEIFITYTVPKENEINTLRDINTFLSSISMASPDEDDPSPRLELKNANYPISMEAPMEWRVVTDGLEYNMLARMLTKKYEVEQIEIHYEEIAEDAREIQSKEGLEYEIDEILPDDAKITFKSTNLKLDGLSGWIIFYDYKNGDVAMKEVTMTVMGVDYFYYIDYSAEAQVFNENIQKVLVATKTIKTKANGGTGEFSIPSPALESAEGLGDIIGHRYRTNIENLIDMNVISGYPDGTFKPENPVNRAEALKIILQSLRAQQEIDGDEPFVMPNGFSMFSDLQSSEWYATYVAEGVDKGIINGYPDGTFKGGNTVNLAEALKMTLQAHGKEIWSGDTDPWYKKYFDAAYNLNILPQDLLDPGKLLTRAELAYIVDQLVQGNK